MQPNANVNNVPMDLVTGFRIEGKFAMSILGGSAAIILRALRDKTKNQTNRNSQDPCSIVTTRGSGSTSLVACSSLVSCCCPCCIGSCCIGSCCIGSCCISACHILLCHYWLVASNDG